MENLINAAQYEYDLSNRFAIEGIGVYIENIAGPVFYEPGGARGNQ
jgi:hypothetical protein